MAGLVCGWGLGCVHAFAKSVAVWTKLRFGCVSRDLTLASCQYVGNCCSVALMAWSF